MKSSDLNNETCSKMPEVTIKSPMMIDKQSSQILYSQTSIKDSCDLNMTYKDKFRARVKTVLKNVRDMEIHEYDHQQRRIRKDGQGSQIVQIEIGQSIQASDIEIGDYPVDRSNAVMFARKAYLILGLQLLASAAWVSLVCRDEEIFNQIYPDSSPLALLAALIILVILGGMYYSKTVFGSYKIHIFISFMLTMSLSYIYGAMAEYISYRTMVYSFTMSLSFIVGLVVYCRITSDENIRAKKASFSGFTFLAMCTTCLHLWTEASSWTLFALWIISSLFGIALVIRTQLMSEHSDDHLLMKHYVFFSMVLYLNFVKTAIYAAVNTFSYKAETRIQSPQKTEVQEQVLDSTNFFSLNADIKQL